ncbi:hypothetical protein RC84_08455 [Pectobacterium carotovorum subsp. carotovorum]|nr:hypothetical protein RC84_08455 [Pectobacterium carotovorum subsp. carotovorum]
MYKMVKIHRHQNKYLSQHRPHRRRHKENEMIKTQFILGFINSFVENFPYIQNIFRDCSDTKS